MIDQRTAPYAALLLRVTLGSLFIAHLYWKFAILDGGLNKWWGNFANNGYSSIGIPPAATALSNYPISPSLILFLGM